MCKDDMGENKNPRKKNKKAEEKSTIKYPKSPKKSKNPVEWLEYGLQYITVLCTNLLERSRDEISTYDKIIEELVSIGWFSEDTEYDYNGKYVAHYLKLLEIVAWNDCIKDNEYEKVDIPKSMINHLFKGPGIIISNNHFERFGFYKIEYKGQRYAIGTFIDKEGWFVCHSFFEKNRENTTFNIYEELIKDYIGKNSVWDNVFLFSCYSYDEIEIMESVHDVSLDDVYLGSNIKDIIKDNSIYFLNNVESLKKRGLDNGRKILLYGEPGNGKSMLMKAIIHLDREDKIRTLIVQPRYDKDINISAVFEIIDILNPVLVIWDDIDIIAQDREVTGGNCVLANLLSELDGASRHPSYALLAATNRLGVVEKALSQRPGRFDRTVEISKPDIKNIKSIFIKNLGKHDLEDKKIDNFLDKVVDEYVEPSGAMMKEIAHSAVIFSEKDGRDCVCMDDIKSVLQQLIISKSDGSRIGFK